MEQCGFPEMFQWCLGLPVLLLRICVCGRVEQGFSNVCLLASWCSQARSMSAFLIFLRHWFVLDACKSDQIRLENLGYVQNRISRNMDEYIIWCEYFLLVCRFVFPASLGRITKMSDFRIAVLCRALWLLVRTSGVGDPRWLWRLHTS